MGEDGAHFAEAIGVHLTFLQWAPGRKGEHPAPFWRDVWSANFIPQVNSVADLNDTV